MSSIELKIGDNTYTARFGLGFLEKVTKDEGISIQEVFARTETNGLFFIPTLIWHSINYGLEREGKDVIPKDVIWDWIDQVGISSAEVIKFANKLGESIMIHVPDDKSLGKSKAKK